MITVKMVRDKGFEFVVGDVVDCGCHGASNYQQIERFFLDDVNDSTFLWLDTKVIEFAWRKNTGEMPCNGELLVDVIFPDGEVDTDKFRAYLWGVDNSSSDIKYWRPSVKNWSDEVEVKKESAEFKPEWAKWSMGDMVTKTKGSNWTGKVVGYYSTELTERGYAVESNTEKGSVQIYPEAALCDIETPEEKELRERLEAAYCLFLEFTSSVFTSFDEFKSTCDVDSWLAIVDKTGYRVK